MTTPTQNSSENMISNQLPIRLTSIVVPGFGRGSKELGIPTANLCKKSLKCKVGFDSLPCGIYWGFARIIQEKKEFDGQLQHDGGKDNAERDTNPSQLTTINYTMKTALSIGYNPVYKNEEKTIEPHLIAPNDHPLRNISKCGETELIDLYGAEIRLSIVGYIRAELPFEGLDKLIVAIKNDIVIAEQLADEKDQTIVDEENWVDSSDDI